MGPKDGVDSVEKRTHDEELQNFFCIRVYFVHKMKGNGRLGMQHAVETENVGYVICQTQRKGIT
jgi:hypothetical protein